MSAILSRKTARGKQSLEAVLQQSVAQGRLHSDAAQAQVARDLDRLHERLIEEYEGRRFWKHSIASLVLQKLTQRLPFGRTGGEQVRGLYLWGKPGSGKSMLMDMFYQGIETSPALAALTRRRTHFLPFMEETHAAIERLHNSSSRDPVARLATRIAKESRLLCFDEFMVEDIADAMLLGRLFARLVRHGVVLVASSNFAPDDLYKDGFRRDSFLPFLELLRQAVVSVHVCSAVDYRSVALARQGRDLWFKEGPAGEKRMRDTFLRLTAMQSENQSLPCEGRPILLRRTGTPSERLRAKGVTRNVVWCDFADVCQKPRGVRDYNALLACCDVLFLADFPVMDETQRNGAKRFMRLVDLFYERRALVLCHSPAASPRALYGGRSHAKEFQRTASRLEEMLARAHALL